VAPTPRSGRSLPEAGLVALAGLLALLVRVPYLSDVPRFTDELQEVLWSLAIARGEILPLTAVDSYYGPVWSYVLAGLFLLFGPNPYLPRLVAAVAGVGLVVLTYYFVREVAGRAPAAIAAGLLLTSGGHIVINSHTARSNSITPIFTTLALWLVHRGVEGRRGQRGVERQAAQPALLIPAGLLLGLALQTHVSVVALVPGLVVYVLWRRPGLLRSPWPYLAGIAGLVGYWNMLLYNLLSGFWSLRHARSLQEGYTSGRSADLDFYLTNLAALLQSMARLLSGTIDAPDNPVRFLYLLLAGAGLAIAARRGGTLLLIATLSVALVLPYFNPRYGPILSGRYLIPLLPLTFAGIGIAVVGVATLLAHRVALPSRQTAARRLAGLAGLLLVLFPLLPLAAYYREAVADGRTNQTLFTLAEAVVVNRQPGERVLLDEGLAQEALGAGGTDLKAYRMLLEAHGIIPDVAKASEVQPGDVGVGTLFLLEAKKRSALARELRATALSPELESASGSDHRYAVYRLTPR
jgi:4-amino-4-deoxy-L-arabinose transferase-like glycosyltransferase